MGIPSMCPWTTSSSIGRSIVDHNDFDQMMGICLRFEAGNAAIDVQLFVKGRDQNRNLWKLTTRATVDTAGRSPGYGRPTRASRRAWNTSIMSGTKTQTPQKKEKSLPVHDT